MQMRIRNILSVLLLIVFLIPLSESKAQNTLSSPYSKYGIGETDLYSNAITSSMGGIGYAMHRNNTVNYLNPASYSAVDSMSFVFDIGFYNNYTILRTNNAKTSGSVGGFSHILFALPLHKTLKIGGGLLPVSGIDFTASETHKEDTINIGHYKASYKGDGGVNKAFLGLSYSPTEAAGLLDNLSIGMNVSYLFGNYYRSKTVSFPDSAQFLSSRVEDNYRISAFTVDFGLQYFQPLKNGDVLGIGLTYATPSVLPTKNQYRHYTFTESAELETIRDSVLSIDGNGEIKIPQSMGVGLSFERPQKFFVELDASYTQWSQFEVQGVPYGDVMKDELKINAGLEYKPDVYGSYFQKISYRFGANYSSGMLYLRDQTINQYGIALGFGLPIKKIGSQINLCLEYGKLGTKEQNLIRKDYFKIGISFSAKDRWFFKRKYQ